MNHTGGNFRDLCKVYNLKSASLEKLLVRKSMREKKYIAELPPADTTKNKIVERKKQSYQLRILQNRT